MAKAIELGSRLSKLLPDFPMTKIDPQRNRTNRLILWDYVKFVIMSPILLIRIGMTAFLVGLCGIVCSIATMGTNQESGEPLSPWRLTVLHLAEGLVRAQLWVAGYYWIETKGEPVSRAEAPILVGNHITSVDPVYLFSHMAAPAVRIESKDLPLVGTIFKAVGALWIDRDAAKTPPRKSSGNASANAGSSGTDVDTAPPPPMSITDKIIARARDTRSGVTRLMIFPEGTCGNGDALMSFKYGAFLPMVPVQPIVMMYKFRWFDPSWVNDGPEGLLLTIRLFCQLYNTMSVQYLPPVDPAKDLPEASRNPMAFGDLVQRRMAEAMDVPVSYVSFLDISMGIIVVKDNKKNKKLKQAIRSGKLDPAEHQADARLSLDVTPLLLKPYPPHVTNAEIKQVTDRIIGHRVDKLPLDRSVRLLTAMDDARVGYVGRDRFISFFLEEEVAGIPGGLQPLPADVDEVVAAREDPEVGACTSEEAGALVDAWAAASQGADTEAKGQERTVEKGASGLLRPVSMEGRRAALQVLFRGFSAPEHKGKRPSDVPRVDDAGHSVFALPPFEVDPARLMAGAQVTGTAGTGVGAASGIHATEEAGEEIDAQGEARAVLKQTGRSEEAELRFVSMRELATMMLVLHAGLSSGRDAAVSAVEEQAKSAGVAGRGLMLCLAACGLAMEAMPAQDRALILGNKEGNRAGDPGAPLPAGPWGRAVSRRFRQLVLGARFDSATLPKPQRAEAQT